MSAGPRPDSPTVWRRIQRGLCGHGSAQTWLESTEARATRSRTKRTGHRPMAPRRMAAAKKRASNGKLAWFFLMKVAICSSLCGGACGLRLAKRRCNMPGTDTIESRRWRHLPARRGRNDSGSTTLCLTITRAPQMWCGSCGTYTDIFASHCCSSVIAGRSIARQSADYNMTGRIGFPSNGSRHTLQNSTRLRTCGIKQSMAT